MAGEGPLKGKRLLLSYSRMSCSGRSNGRGFRSTDQTTVNSEIVAPMPTAITSNATAENPGCRASVRMVIFKSRRRVWSLSQLQTSRSLLADHSGIAEGAQGGMAGLFWSNAAFPLLFFFQLKVRLQFPFQIGIALPDLPPFHLSSPQLRATSPAPQLLPSASIEILRRQAVFFPYR